MLSEHFTYLQSILPETGWVVAGGSCSDTNYFDIDIYCESEQIATKLITIFDNLNYTRFDSTNVVTFLPNPKISSWFNIKIQIVTKTYGTVIDILNTFDLNKSCIAILPSGKVVTLPVYDRPLYIIFNNFRYNTISRFYKYITTKSYPVKRSTIQNLYQYCINNINKTYDIYYENAKASVIVPLLNFSVTSIIIQKKPIVTYNILIDVVESLPKQLRFNVYNKFLSHIHNRVWNIPQYKTKSMEFQYFYTKYKNLLPSKELLNTYPELFV